LFSITAQQTGGAVAWPLDRHRHRLSFGIWKCRVFGKGASNTIEKSFFWVGSFAGDV
jgi:hypothetical protein